MFDPLARLLDERRTARWCRRLTLRWYQRGQVAHRQHVASDANPGTHAELRIAAGAAATRALLEGPDSGATLRAALGDPASFARTLNVSTRFPQAHVSRGVFVGVVIHAYLEWVMDACDREGIRRVYFVSREGATLARAFNALARSRRSRAAARATYLPASRLSTFLPSLDDLSATSLARLWTQYPGQTLHQLLRNLSLPGDPFLVAAARHGLNADAPIDDLAALVPFFDDADVRRAFASHRDAARASLVAYLTRKGFFVDHAIAMGDVGWKGSIQTNIERAIRAHHVAASAQSAPTAPVPPTPPIVHGLYLALRRDHALDTAPSTRAGFIADSQRDDDWPASCIFRAGSIFEVALSVPHRCVAAYADNSASSSPQLLPDTDPVFASLNAVEREIFRGPARLTRIACLRTLSVLREHAVATSRQPPDPRAHDSIHAWLVDALRREIIYPTRESADSFLEHAHVETFGVFQPSRFDFVTPWPEVFRGSPVHWPHRLRVALEAHFWPDAIVRRSGIPLANFAFDLMLTRRAR